jgi:hypothetical protein
MTATKWINCIGSLLFLALGLHFVYGALEMEIGTARRMGPGYFPLVLGALVCGLAILSVIKSFFEVARTERVDVRSFAAVSAGVAAFAFVTSNFGIVPAAFLSVLASSLADSRLSIHMKLVLAVGVSLAVWLVFILALQLPFEAFRTP